MMELGGPLWLKMADPTELRGRLRLELAEDTAIPASGRYAELHCDNDLAVHVERSEGSRDRHVGNIEHSPQKIIPGSCIPSNTYESGVDGAKRVITSACRRW